MALDCTEDLELTAITTPNPYPPRGIYGFALYLCSCIVLILYLIWAIVPTPWLEAINIAYVPSKYWAIAIPLLMPIGFTAYICIIIAINILRFQGVFDNVDVIHNDFDNEQDFDTALLEKFLESNDMLSRYLFDGPTFRPASVFLNYKVVSACEYSCIYHYDKPYVESDYEISKRFFVRN